MEKRVKTEKSAVELKQKQVEEKQSKLRADEDFHRKQKSDWDSQSARRLSELEEALREKRELMAKLDKEQGAKTADLAKRQNEFEQFRQNEERKIKDQAKRAEEDRKNLENQKKLLQDKDSRLEADRKNLETEIAKRVEALRA